MKHHVFSLICASSFFISCSVTVPEYDLSDPGVVVPGSWAAGASAKAGVDTQWVSRFRDARLKALVDEGLAANKDLKIASARVERARSAVTIATSALKPSSSLEFNGRRNQQNFVGLPFGGSLISENYGLNLSVDWELDIWGRIRADRAATIAELQAESQTYRAARASLVAQICRAYYSAVEAREQVELAKGSLEILSKTETAIRERYESALSDDAGTASQLRLAQTDIASAKATLAEREGLHNQTLRQLETLLGRYPKATVSTRSKLPDVPARPPSGLPSGLLTRRPDILSAERSYASSKSRIKEAHLAKFPSFSLTGSTGSTTSSLSNVLSSSAGVWSIGGDIFQPILLNGRTQAEIDVRVSRSSEALAELQKTVLNAFSEVEQALAAEQNLAKREAAVVEALTLAKEASDAAERDYAGGTGDILTLLTTRNRFITIGSQLAALKRLRLLNRIDLHLALGGDYKASSK